MTYYAGADLARNFRVVRKNTLQIANEIPETQYGFRGSRTPVPLGVARPSPRRPWTFNVHARDKDVCRSKDFDGAARKTRPMRRRWRPRPTS